MLQVYVLNISVVLNIYCKYFIWMLHMLQLSYTHVASVCCKYFICFGRMLQQMLHVATVPFYEQAREGDADGGGPLGRSGPCVRDSPTCMRTVAVGTCVRIMVLGLGVLSIECVSTWDHAHPRYQ